ncbi:MAG: MarR family transcriptional regulator [Actinomycetota bacterium]|nr:MarR family transcriptional regulator [Actinomycetota bacterium]
MMPVSSTADPVRVGRALARLSRLLEQASSDAGLTLAQYRVLVFVADRPERASALAVKVDVRRATLSAIVGGLERAGLLQRVAVEGDGRGVQLQVTPEGRAALAMVDDTLGSRLADVIAAGAVAGGTLAAELERMIAGFEAVCGSPERAQPGSGAR